jgi:hypothetical protein
MELADCDKHSSFLWYEIQYSSKKFYGASLRCINVVRCLQAFNNNDDPTFNYEERRIEKKQLQIIRGQSF